MADVVSVLGDLVAESDELDDLVRDLDADGWQRPTPAEGWSIADQIGHLAWTDEIATLAASDAEAFTAVTDRVIARFDTTVDSAVDQAAATRAALPPAELLDLWRAGRQRLADALADAPAGQKLPWFGPPMSPTSMATARLMETWAHGQDIADSLGVTRTPTDRLRHVAHIGVRTRDFAYLVRGRAVPGEQFRIELVGPSGALWAWGPDDAAQQIAGPALDFCLLVTQRRHLDDLALVASGADAQQWLTIAQAFAGPSGGGRVAGQFS